MPYNPASLDPMTGRNLTDFDFLYALYDALIDFEPATLELKPGLAKSWRFTDKTTLMLELVDNARFHDGTPFNAQAVVFNLERYKNDQRSNVKADLNTVASVAATGPYQVTLKLTKPNSGLPAILTNRVGIMVSPKAVQDRNGNIDRTPVGTGPFKFVEWQDNTIVRMTRNENYWQAGLPYVDALDIRIINDLNTAARTVIVGETDLGLNLIASQKAIADRSPNVIAVAMPSLVLYGAFLNYSKPPLSNVKVRQALNYAINRAEINEVVTFGTGQPSSAVLPTAHWACDPATANYYTHDLAKARQLLAEAGYPGGVDLESAGWPDQVAIQRQELIISQLAKAGIRVKLTPAQPAMAAQMYFVERKADMFISPSSAFPDPSMLYDQLFSKDAYRNAGKVEMPGFAELLDATMEASDQAVRKAAFAKLQRFVVENALQVVQFLNAGVTIRGKHVQNFKPNLLTIPKLTDVWLSA
jgi:peptide/nickel transport system substrate-binding protein/glutathione transport system substrate-binding protein